MLPVKRYCNVCLNQHERLYDWKLLYGQYLCLCLCILYVEWPARARAEAGWSSIYDHFIADLTLPITRRLPPRRQADHRSIPWAPRSVTRTQRPLVSGLASVSLIRDTKIFVSRCLEAAGRPHNATIHPAIYFPAKHDLCELFMIFLFDHKDFIQLSQEPRQQHSPSKQQF